MAIEAGNRHASGRSVEAGGEFVVAETGLLRTTFFVAAGVILLALIAVPAARHGAETVASNGYGDIDRMTTGSIDRADRYTVRRSVLHNANGDACLILKAGEKVSTC